MSRIVRSSDGFQPDCRSSWQHDRASASFERAPHGSRFVSAAICAVLIGFVFYVLVSL